MKAEVMPWDAEEGAQIVLLFDDGRAMGYLTLSGYMVPNEVDWETAQMDRARAVAAHAVRERRVPVLIVQRALARIGEDLVGLLGFLEFFLRRGIIGTTVRMQLHRHAAERFLELVVVGRAADTEHFVVANFLH